MANRGRGAPRKIAFAGLFAALLLVLWKENARVRDLFLTEEPHDHPVRHLPGRAGQARERAGVEASVRRDSAKAPQLGSLRRSSTALSGVVAQGRVLSSSGSEPIAGASICLLRSRSSGGKGTGEPVKEAFSDSRGYYTVESGELSHGWIVCTKAGYAEVAEEITLAEVGPRSRDFRLLPAQAVVRGTVRDLFSSQPLAKVRIEWLYKRLGSEGASAPSPRFSSTDATGFFELSELALAKGILKGYLPGFFDSEVPVELQTGDNEVELTLVKGEELILRIEDRGGDPVAGALVEGPDGRVLSADELGEARLTVMPEFDKIHCRVWGDGYLERQIDLAVPAREQVVILDPAPEITGRVESSQGKPVVGAMVQPMGTPALMRHLQAPQLQAVTWVPQLESSTYTDASGVFSLAVSNPPLMGLKVTHPDYVDEWIDLEGRAAAPLLIEMEPGSTELSGLVTDGRAEPVLSFTLVVQSVDDIRQTIVNRFEDPGGHFSLTSLKAGGYRVSAYCWRFDETSEQMVLLQTATPREVDLKRGGRVQLSLEVTEKQRPSEKKNGG